MITSFAELAALPELRIETAAQAALDHVLAVIASGINGDIESLLSRVDLDHIMAGLDRDQELAVERHPRFQVACALAATAQEADLANSVPMQEVIAAWEQGLLSAGLPLSRIHRHAA
jgi:hypothetical protein